MMWSTEKLCLTYASWSMYIRQRAEGGRRRHEQNTIARKFGGTCCPKYAEVIYICFNSAVAYILSCLLRPRKMPTADQVPLQAKGVEVETAKQGFAVHPIMIAYRSGQFVGQVTTCWLRF